MSLKNQINAARRAEQAADQTAQDAAIRTPGDYIATLYSNLPDTLFINLAAINDGGFVGECLPLDANLVQAVNAFCEKHSDKNVYYGVNPLGMKAESGKAKKEDLTEEVLFVQVDIDPSEHVEDLTAWKQRRLEGIGKATAIIDSGGGLQAIFRLTDTVDIERAEQINRLLRERHDGDKAATDATRLMRMPFTRNYPNKRKREKGRKEAPTKLLHFEPITGHPDDLGPDLVDSLPVSDKIKHTIRTGDRHPDDDKRPYDGPSEARFAVLRAMLRAGIDEETIREVVLNSPVTKQNPPRSDWLGKDIERARKDLVPPEVKQFIDLGWNIVLLGNKVRVIRREPMPELKRMILKALDKGQFVSFYEDRYHFEQQPPTANGQPRPPVKIIHTKQFFDSKLVPRYADVVVNPQRPGHYRDANDEWIFNVWQGYSVEPRDHGGRARDLLKNHFLRVWADDDAVLGDYIWKWFCWKIQNPEKLPKVALGIRGEKGTGKSIAAIVPFRLLGNHFVHLMNDSLTDRFNSEQLDALAILADEAVFAGNPALANNLKGLITEMMRLIEMKGIDKITVPNRLAMVFISNDEHFLPASDKERRYCIARANNLHQNDDEYFEPFFRMADGQDDGGLEDLLYWMLEEDLTDFNIRKFPRTRELVHQQMHQLSIVQEWWLGKLKAGKVHRYGLKNLHHWEEIPGDWRYNDFLDYCNRRRVRTLSPEAFGSRLNALLPETVEMPKKPGVKVQQRRTTKMLPVRLDGGALSGEMKAKQDVYVIAPLAECRQHFVDTMGEGWTLDDVTGADDDSENAGEF